MPRPTLAWRSWAACVAAGYYYCKLNQERKNLSGCSLSCILTLRDLLGREIRNAEHARVLRSYGSTQVCEAVQYEFKRLHVLKHVHVGGVISS